MSIFNAQIFSIKGFIEKISQLVKFSCEEKLTHKVPVDMPFKDNMECAYGNSDVMTEVRAIFRMALKWNGFNQQLQNNGKLLHGNKIRNKIPEKY